MATVVNPKLSNLAKEWKNAEAILPTYSNVPEGDYVGALKEMKVDEAKKTGRLQVVSTYEIVDGDYTGQTVKRFDGLVDKTSMGYFKGYAQIIGFEVPDDLELLQEAMDEFVGSCADLFNVHVAKSKGDDGKDYTNVYVNGISDLVMGDEQATEEGQEIVDESELEGQLEEEEIAQEEEVQEEVQEEPQQITAPIKRFSSKPVQQAKKAAPVAQAKATQKVQQTAKPAVKTAAPQAGVRRIVAAKR